MAGAATEVTLPDTYEQREMMRVFGARVREYRERAGMTQAELGVKVGRAVSMISAIENGSRKVYVGELSVWASVLKVPMHVLLGYDDVDRYEAGWRSGYEAAWERVSRLARDEGAISAGIYPGEK